MNFFQQFLMLLIFLTFSVLAEDTIKVPTDVCNRNYLDIQCMQNQVIVVNSAKWGRMSNSSNCIKSNFGHIGCFANVEETLTSTCATKKSCNYKVNNLENGAEIVSTCPPGLKSYLSIDYECVTLSKFDHIVKQLKDVNSNEVYYTFTPEENREINLPELRKVKIDALIRDNTPVSTYGTFVMKDKEDNILPYSNVKRTPTNSWGTLVETNSTAHLVVYTGGDEKTLLKIETIGCGPLALPSVLQVIDATHNYATVKCKNATESIRIDCVGEEWKYLQLNCPGLVFDESKYGQDGIDEKAIISSWKFIVPTTLLVIAALGTVFTIVIVRYVKRHNVKESASSISTEV